MSSKLTGKPSKKDRPKSSDKLRKGRKDGGTPEKPSTPNASQGEMAEEEATPQVIINDEILALQIKPEDLQQLREPRPPSDTRSPRTRPVVVRKLKPASEWDKPKPKNVIVAKPAPPDAPLVPHDYSQGAGPRFLDDGQVVPHSILGTVEDYKKRAAEHGDLPQELTVPRPDSQQGRLSVKYEKKRPKPSPGAPKGFPKFQSVTESNALENWQTRMRERKKQQGHLARALNKSEDQLVMNQADSYRKTQELRYMVDRTIAHVDYGKGYRIGSEFWKQQEQLGDDITGLHMTLTQTEKGYPPPVEHVDVPNSIKKEKGTLFPAGRSPFHKPWHRTPYLAERLSQLRPMMSELDPVAPDMVSLEVVGRNRPWSGRRPWSGSSERAVVERAEEESRRSSAQRRTPGTMGSVTEDEERERMEEYDPLASHPDVYPEPVFGPSVVFAGQPARWTGDSETFQGQIGIEARVTFEAYAGKRTTSFLEIVNDGTTSIYYDWKKVPKVNPFDMANPKTQRFYFNTSNGVILPGDKMKFPFVFKSLTAGVFSEQWQFETSPVVCGGAALVVTLRGVALQEDKYKPHRDKIEDGLKHKQAVQVVSGILDGILEGIQSPDRPCSPIDAHITEEEIFTRNNRGLYYHNETISRLKKCYTDLFPAEEREDAPDWDMSIDTLKQMIMSQEPREEEEEEAAMDRKQTELDYVNRCVHTMAFPPFTPRQQQMYLAGYDILCDLVDNIVGRAMELRHMLGMPEKEEGGIPEEPTRSGSPGTESVTSSISASESGQDVTRPDGQRRQSRRLSQAFSIASNDSAPASRPTTRSDSRTPSSREGRKGGAKGGGGGKPDPKKAAKEVKSSGKGGKEASKAGGKTTSGKRPPTREKVERSGSPTSSPQSPLVPTSDPLVLAKYKERIYAQAHSLVDEAMTEVASVFNGVELQDGGPRIPTI